ncbi:MAG: sulfotransferase, partial [Chromatiaceae bacterium]|nr:sulfotransferase [Chromatiaceae bacterium]
IPLFALVQAIHWIGFLLDELFFRGYRRVEIREPLFVLGVPRSGTTHLHRVLAEDEQFTTFSTWECFFALSVSARRFWMGLGRLDARIGRPLERLLGVLERLVFGALDDVHSMRLSDPEEDYFAFTPALACFILMLPFPQSERIWRMGTFDRDLSARERERLMHYYHRCLQKHLYVHGPERRLLSKNAAFAPLAGSLREHFPDARFLVCLRPPTQTLPSQLSSIEGGLALFDSERIMPELRTRLGQQLGFYYSNLHEALANMPASACFWVTMSDLKGDLSATIQRFYQRLGLRMSTAYQHRLRALDSRSRGYQSAHRYSLDQFGLSAETIEQELGPLYSALLARRDASMGAPLAAPGLQTESAASC